MPKGGVDDGVVDARHPFRLTSFSASLLEPSEGFKRQGTEGSTSSFSAAQVNMRIRRPTCLLMCLRDQSRSVIIPSRKLVERDGTKVLEERGRRGASADSESRRR